MWQLDYSVNPCTGVEHQYLYKIMEKVYKIAEKEIGVTEVVGDIHNPRILEYFKKVGHSWVKDDELAWCAAYLGWVLEEAGISSTKKLNARSYLDWGVEVSNPKRGDIVVFWRGDKNGPYGHVGFFHSFDDNGDILVLGGNQANMVNISTYPKYRLLGFRRDKVEVSDLERKVADLENNLEKLTNITISILKLLINQGK